MIDHIKIQQGVTMIELVVSIVVLSIAITGVLMVMTQTITHSADPMIRDQATAVARSYMEEIMAHPLEDPNDVEVNGTESGESRSNYDDIWDYDNLSNSAGAIDQNGTSVAGLEGYNITVDVTTASVGPGAGSPALRIEVEVTHDGLGSINIPLVAHRLN